MTALPPASPATSPPHGGAPRAWEMDALRGLMLVLMTVTHLPTRLTLPLGQPFGFVSAAEGFVLLSAFMAALVYSRVARHRGVAAMHSAFAKRARKIYWCHAASMLFLFTVVAAVGHEIDAPDVKNLMNFYLEHPLPALVGSLLLAYQPPLLDILPLYVLFMLASPFLLAHAARRGWAGVLGFSVAIWLLAQVGLGRWVYELLVAATGLSVPLREMGSFSTGAWQLIWVLGLWMGAVRSDPQAPPFAVPRGAVVLAAVFALAMLVWRHAIGQVPFPAHPQWNLVLDKWQLGPLRLLNLVALVLLVLRFGPAAARRLPRQRWLETLGSASLPVFCAHLVAVLLALALIGTDPQKHSAWVDALALALCFGLLYAVAVATQWFDRAKRLRPGGERSALEYAEYLPPPIVETAFPSRRDRY